MIGNFRDTVASFLIEQILPEYCLRCFRVTYQNKYSYFFNSFEAAEHFIERNIDNIRKNRE